MKIYSLINILIASIISFMLVACSNRNVTKLYDGPEQPPEKLAYIVMDCSGTNSCSVKIFKETSGIKVQLFESFFKNPNLWSKPLKVLPGKYTVQVKAGNFDIVSGMIRGGAFNIGTKSYGPALCSVEFNIDTGKTFYVKVEIDELNEVSNDDLNSAGKKGLIVEKAVDDISRDYGYNVRGARETTLIMKYKYNLIRLETTVIDKATMQNMTACSFDSFGKTKYRDVNSFLIEWQEEEWEKQLTLVDKKEKAKKWVDRRTKLASLSTDYPTNVKIIDLKLTDNENNVRTIKYNYGYLEPGNYTVYFSLIPNSRYDLEYKLKGRTVEKQIRQLTFDAKAGHIYILSTWYFVLGSTIYDWGGGIKAVSYFTLKSGSYPRKNDQIIAGNTQEQYLYEKDFKKVTNLDDPEVLKSLISALGSESSRVSEYAIEKLSRSKTSETIALLLKVLKSQDQGFDFFSFLNKKKNAIKALTIISDTSTVKPLLKIIKDYSEDWETKREAFIALCIIGDPRASNGIVKAMKDHAHWETRTSAVDGKKFIIKPFEDYFTIKALSKVQSELAISPLIEILKSPDWLNRSAAAEALAKFNKPDVIDALIDALADDYVSVRSDAAKSLGNFKSVKVIEALKGALIDYEEQVRINTAESLGKIGSSKAIEPLISRLKYDGIVVRKAALRSLRTITAENLSPNYNEWQNWWDINKQKFE